MFVLFVFVLFYQFSAEYLQVFQAEIRKVKINFDKFFWSCLAFLLTLPFIDTFLTLSFFKC